MYNNLDLWLTMEDLPTLWHGICYHTYLQEVIFVNHSLMYMYLCFIFNFETDKSRVYPNTM